jgi:hypothetical protein
MALRLTTSAPRLPASSLGLCSSTTYTRLLNSAHLSYLRGTVTVADSVPELPALSVAGGVSDLHFGSHVCHLGPFVKEVMMALIPVFCPHCQSDQVIKGGKTQVSKQRYKC